MACVDLASDDANCGACGHACAATSACARGVCGPAPTIVVPKPVACGEMRLVAAGDTLYWTDTAGGAVMAMPAAGGTPAPLSGSETKAPTLLTVTGSTIFWLDGKTIRKMAGDVISDVYTNLDDVNGLAVSDDGATVYFSTGQKVQSVPAAGGGTPVDVEIHNSGDPAALAVAGSYLASTVSDLGAVNVIGLGGPTALCWTMDANGDTSLDVNCNRVARGQGELNTAVIVAAGSKVLFADGPDIKMGDLVVDNVPRSWDPVTENESSVGSMVVSAGMIYFDTSGAVMPEGDVVAKSPMTVNSPPLRLARNVTTHTFGSLAVSGQKVFWVTSDCAIQSVPTGE